MRFAGWNPTSRFSVITLFKAILFCLALASVGYALITAHTNALDFYSYYNGAREWIDGLYLNESSALFTYPPFLIPLLSPLALLPSDQAHILWLGINLLAAGLSVHVTSKLYGDDWPADAKYYLYALMFIWSPFRVAIRVGQITLIITALISGALLARKQNKKVLAGVLLALSLCKFTLSFPFFLYFIWKREWKSLAASVVVMFALTQIYAFRLGLSIIEVASNYAVILSKFPTTTNPGFIGATEIKPLLLLISGGNNSMASLLHLIIFAAAIVSIIIVFRCKPQAEKAHFAVLALFALWVGYHRNYDVVLCVLLAALLIDFFVRKKFPIFSKVCLTGLLLLALTIPGFLTARLGLSRQELSNSALGLLGLHLDRILVFAMFWSLLWLLWRADPDDLQFADEEKRLELAQLTDETLSRNHA